MPFTKAELSKMLWNARETADMAADITLARTGQVDVHNLALRELIDTFRDEQGWSRSGFGGEGDERALLA